MTENDPVVTKSVGGEENGHKVWVGDDGEYYLKYKDYRRSCCTSMHTRGWEPSAERIDKMRTDLRKAKVVAYHYFLPSVDSQSDGPGTIEVLKINGSEYRVD